MEPNLLDKKFKKRKLEQNELFTYISILHFSSLFHYPEKNKILTILVLCI